MSEPLECPICKRPVVYLNNGDLVQHPAYDDDPCAMSCAVFSPEEWEKEVLVAQLRATIAERDAEIERLQNRNDNQAKTITELFEKHPEDAPGDEEDSGSYDSLVPDEYKSSWIDDAARTIKYIKENRANADRLCP